jgi:hypothetical protein
LSWIVIAINGYCCELLLLWAVIVTNCYCYERLLLWIVIAMNGYLYHCENKLIFNEMMMSFALYNKMTIASCNESLIWQSSTAVIVHNNNHVLWIIIAMNGYCHELLLLWTVIVVNCYCYERLLSWIVIAMNGYCCELLLLWTVIVMKITVHSNNNSQQ